MGKVSKVYKGHKEVLDHHMALQEVITDCQQYRVDKAELNPEDRKVVEWEAFKVFQNITAEQWEAVQSLALLVAILAGAQVWEAASEVNLCLL